MPDFTSLPEITALYAGIFGLMSVGVAFPAGQLRGKTGVSIGDGGNPELLLAMRRHANFIETVPLALILIGLIEMNGGPDYAIHGFGVVLIVARLAHAFGLKADTIQSLGRLVGAAGSALTIVVASIWCIYTFVS